MMKTEILIGTLLGDAYIPKLPPRGRNYHIRWTHCKKQRAYAIWKANNVDFDYSIYERTRHDIRTGKYYDSIEIISRTHEDYKYLRYLFYRSSNRKIIREDILELLTPLTIAIWYCDNGNLYISKGKLNHLTICTNNFTKNSTNKIIKVLKDKYGINFKITTCKSIRITSKSEINKFMSIIGCYIPKEMEYKRCESFV